MSETKISETVLENGDVRRSFGSGSDFVVAHPAAWDFMRACHARGILAGYPHRVDGEWTVTYCVR